MEWEKKTLFENRPIITNQPVKVRAGFQGTFGTYGIPVGHFYMQNFGVSEDSLKVDVGAVDSWGFYGDKPIGTIAEGTYSISRLVSRICNNVGIEKDRRFISQVNNSYKNIPVFNNKEQEKPRNNGGFGDTYRTFQLTYNDDRIQTQAMTQTTNGSYRVLLNGLNNFDSLGTKENLINPFYRITDHNFNTLYNSESPGAFQEIRKTGRRYSFNKVALQDFSDDTLITFHFLKGFDSIPSGSVNQTAVYHVKKKSGWYFEHIGTYANPFDIVNNNYGCYFDSDTGTGYITNKQDGTQKLYRYNLSNGTFKTGNSLVFAGTTDIGTIEVDALFEMPRPYDVYQGTYLKWVCIYGRDGTTGTTQYMYRYNLLGGSSLEYIDRATLSNTWQIGTQLWGNDNYYGSGTALRSGGWIRDNNIYEVLGHVNHTYITNNYNAHLGRGNQFHRLGHFGFTYQHNTIVNVGSVYLNEVQLGTGSYVNTTDRTQFYFNDFYYADDFFTSSYTISGLSVGIGETTGKSFKETIEKLSIPANHYAWFDGNGNFFFKSRDNYFKKIAIADNIERSHNLTLNENFISGDVSKDVNKVKNKIIVKGTGATGTNIYIDALSIDIYGTRDMSVENSFIQRQADSGTLGQMLVENLKFARYEVNTSIPFHPEVELVDRISYTDNTNRIAVNNATIKKVTHNLDDWTTTIQAVDIPPNKTGD